MYNETKNMNQFLQFVQNKKGSVILNTNTLKSFFFLKNSTDTVWVIYKSI